MAQEQTALEQPVDEKEIKAEEKKENVAEAESQESVASSPQPISAGQSHLSGEFWLNANPFDPHSRLGTWKQRRKFGKETRVEVPRIRHAEFSPATDRPSPVDTILSTNAGRQQDLIPLRMARMSASAFTFYRGAADIMAWDLSRTPYTGFPVVMSGDAHLSNFGLYATPQREVIFDMNDFDEAVIGPWEWDLKRLATSVNIAGRDNGMKPKERRTAVMLSVRGYCGVAALIQAEGIIPTWYRHMYPEKVFASKPYARLLGVTDAMFNASIEIWSAAIGKAKGKTNETLLSKVAVRKKGKWAFKYDPPVLSPVSQETKDKITQSLVEYTNSLTAERRFMFRRYHVEDVAHRVVGVGSVGVRAYLVMMFGNGPTDPLFLQVKEASSPAHAQYLPEQFEEAHQGWRVVTGQRLIQSSTDFMLGWTTIDGRPFYIRQMNNMKGSIPIEMLSKDSLGLYAYACGSILARGHARTGDIAKISGYCGNGKELGEVFADFADLYADQNERDHAQFVAEIKSGRIKAADSI